MQTNIENIIHHINLPGMIYTPNSQNLIAYFRFNCVYLHANVETNRRENEKPKYYSAECVKFIFISIIKHKFICDNNSISNKCMSE